MRAIHREDLRIGYTIAYTIPDTNTVLHGPILHIGLGLSARNAVWIRCTDGPNEGRIDFVMLEHIVAVVSSDWL